MTLRDKYMALLMAFSQEQSGIIESGILQENIYQSYNTWYLRCYSWAENLIFTQTRNGIFVYFNTIPQGATKLILYNVEASELASTFRSPIAVTTNTGISITAIENYQVIGFAKNDSITEKLEMDLPQGYNYICYTSDVFGGARYEFY